MIAPRDRDGRKRIPSHDRLQWKLDGDFKVRREDRADFLDHGASIRFESICRIIETMPEKNLDKQIGCPV